MHDHEVTIRAIQQVKIGDVEFGLLVAFDNRPVALFELKTDADRFVQQCILDCVVNTHVANRAKLPGKRLGS